VDVGGTRVTVAELARVSGVGFGTSGARGRVVDMTDRVCAGYVEGFLQVLHRRGELEPSREVAIGGDRRPSTSRILGAVAAGIRNLGHELHYSGLVPSPALALLGLSRGWPTVMVTGSHIPDDRNGIKFTTREGEITKGDEREILAAELSLGERFDAAGRLRDPGSARLGAVQADAECLYLSRYLDAYPRDLLANRRIVVYGHSAVGRELLVTVLEGLGASVVRVGWSEEFIPVDTEAIHEREVALGREVAREHRPFAIVSTDGDSDRPLVADGSGEWIRGDVLGVLAARELGAQVVVTPVSSNTVVERCGAFREVHRTKIGSPYVIEAMTQAVRAGSKRVLGYEANGGMLLQTSFEVIGGGKLEALPTRDPLVVMLSVFASAARRRCSVAALSAELPRRVTASGRLQGLARTATAPLLDELAQGGPSFATKIFGAVAGVVQTVELTDGVRLTTAGEEVVHLRSSGNAPELRCYAESDSHERAERLVTDTLGLVERELVRK